jgi:small-conductance mechanosensitive channel
MKTKILFPNHFKRIGWIILIPSAILGVLSVFDVVKFGFLSNVKMFAIYSDDFPGSSTIFGFVKNNISDEILGILCIVGAILVAFSKEKHEDEFIAKIRMESLVWATYINYAILILCMLFFYSIGFLYVMIFNMFTILLFFIIRFYYLLYKSNKSMSHEK